ncbi:MAG: hypothetical protein V1734_07145 [Nanoarchaeota archaeon]
MSEEKEYFRNRRYHRLWKCTAGTGDPFDRKKDEAAKLLLEALSSEENLGIAERICKYADVFMGFNKEIERKTENSAQGLEGILSKMRAEVDSLALCRTDPVAIKYGGFFTWFALAAYNLFSCSISVSKKIPEKGQPTIIAHEYSHHVQNSAQNADTFAALPVLSEGMADAVGIAATKSYAHAHNDGKALHFAEQTIEDRMSKAVRLIHSSFTKLEFNAPKNYSRADIYSIGCAAFLVAEIKRGQGIYRDILRAENPLGMLVKALGGGR